MRKWFFIVLPPAFLLIYVFANYMLSSVKQSTAKTFRSDSFVPTSESDQINDNPSVPNDSTSIKSLPPKPKKQAQKYTGIHNTNQPVNANSQGILRTSPIRTQKLSQEENTKPSSKKTDVQQIPSVTNATTFIESPPPKQNFSISFVDTQTLEPGHHLENVPVGGLSALSYDPTTETFFALSDDKGNLHNNGQRYHPRFYEMKLDTENYIFDLKKHIFLQSGNDQLIQGIDPEGMVFLSPDKIFISSEGAQMSTLTTPPAVFEYNSKGQLRSKTILSGVFWPNSSEQIGSYGVKENKSFEAFTVDVKNNHLWLATEKSLHQDDLMEPEGDKPQPNTEYIRFTQLALNNMKMSAQYIYPMQSYFEQGALSGENGVTDFLFLDGKRFIVIERAYLRHRDAPASTKQNANLIQLFLADCSRANDVSRYQALQGNQFVTCGKKPIISDLSEVVNGHVDNIEGIAKGPEVAPGQFVLVLVSDNNFSPDQKTQFLFFHYKPNF